MTEEIKLSYDLSKNTQETLKHVKGNLTKVEIPLRSFGPVTIKLFYLNLA